MQTGLLHRFNLTEVLKPLLLLLSLLASITSYSQTASSNRFKRIDYEYDLVSGKVNKVSYQKDSADQFIHQYSYDSDNRITKVETSSDNVVWDVDAKYFYYAHGPLARTEIGNDKVQGIDYAYTLQGWIKGVNSNTLDKERDMGQDGKDTSIYDPNSPQLHANFAQDAFGYSLNYFKGDYKAINQVRWNNATNRFEAVTTGSELMQQTHDLYNGNIKSMVNTITQIDTTPAGNVNPQIPKPLGNAYKYDQLNRIKKSVSYKNIDLIGNLWQSSGQTIANMYANTFSYDANGNILTQNRSDENGQEFEALNYKYRTLAGNLRQNRLYHVNDNISYTSLKTDDIDNQGHFANGASSSPLIDSVGQFNNYSYDNIGNLVKDKAEQIASIEWTIYGKVKKITRNSGSTRDNIIFDYDPMGNRIAKHVYDNANNWKYTTYYVRDAQGNIMGTYEHKNIPPPGGIGSPSMSFVLQEQHIYGSSRLGMNTPNKELIATSYSLSNLTHTIGKKYFEITNHLGSVTTVISDRKIPIGTGTAITYYQSDIISSTDFAVFGAPLSARDFSSSKYNFGFGGQQKDDNISGKGNHNTALFWEYDTRLGRRWNMDPKPNYSLSFYGCFADNPVLYSDLLGDTISVDLFDTKTDGATFHDVAKTSVTKQVDDGVFLVFAHANSAGIQYTDKKGNKQLARTAEEFKKVMSERSPEFKKAIKEGKEIVIKIYACNTASEEYVSHDGRVIKRDVTVAEKISEGLPEGSKVIAADGYVWYGKTGGKPAIKGVQQTDKENPENTNKGGFITFINGKKTAKKVMSYDNKKGTTTSGQKKKLKDE